MAQYKYIGLHAGQDMEPKDPRKDYLWIVGTTDVPALQNHNL